MHGDPGSRAFPLAVGLNLAFVAVEFGAGLWANSTALLADAGHNLSDVLGLLLAWGAAVLSRRQPAGRFTYGLRSSSILAALGNAMLLLVACGAIALEAVRHLLNPGPVAGMAVIAVAASGIVVNGFSAWLFMSGSRNDLNQRAAFLHLLADAGVSLAVVLGGIAMMTTGWYWLDPLLSILIVAAIVAGTWGLLREALRLSVHAVPAHIDLEAVYAFIAAQAGVAQVHDLHIWPMSTTESALTVSLVMPGAGPDDIFLDQLEAALRLRFGIGHSTVQIRHATPTRACSLD
ncbi:MAG: cobalt transporter [Paucimonas sp.]|nr:cobalt transporter [Paucimonas sp.]